MLSVTSRIDAGLARQGAPSLARREGDRWTVLIDESPTGAEAFAHSVARGLSAAPRWLNCRYLYDAAGSDLFLAITEQPEYYLTRAEEEILVSQSDAIRKITGPLTLVELGAGAARKTRHLLDAWTRAADEPVHFVPIDIDPAVLTSAAERLTAELPDLSVTAIATSYQRGLSAVAGCSPMCVVFLGSTIGNLNPEETDAFLERLSVTLSAGDALLLGADLVKDVDVLEAAYNDAAGISEAFTRNLFERMNRELGTNVAVDAVEHVAYWNDRLERIEIYARFRDTSIIELPSIGRRFRIAAGEMILTEISRKYRLDRIATDFARFGFRLDEAFTDSGARFGLLLFRRIEQSTGPPAWARLASRLQAARRRTFDLIDLLTDEELAAQVSPILSPIAWDLAHMAEFEELWLVHAVDAVLAGADERITLARDYDAIATPRSDRGKVDLPGHSALLDRLHDVRHAAISRLRSVSLDSDHPLLGDGFVYCMVAQHEAQHQETILQSIALMERAYEPAYRTPTPRATLPPDTDMVIVPGGSFPVGAEDLADAYDNEKPVHWVDVPAFHIDTAPVTNGRFREFVEAGGYDDPAWWTDEGWAWREHDEVRHPGGWRATAGGWEQWLFGHTEPLVPTRPVMHVSWYEADACARWAGKRLPTEFEWEKAAAWDPELRITRRYPWGDEPRGAEDGNLDAVTYASAPIGAYPRSRSFYGCHQMIGDVWEWTASEFLPYPGFEAFPYPEYSEVHFGKRYRVLRGGSWATASIAIRNTFRNWDLPERRHIFAGFRCARDA